MNADSNPAKAIFLEAVETHTPDLWPDFLDRVCAGQPELRDQVEALLKAHQEVGTAQHREFAQGADPRPVAADAPTPATESPGTVIGPYKLIEPIGEGGMGAVWMAQQTEPVKRLVAVKLIRAGMDSKQVVARFQAERQALALMDHPNIARVLDGGTTAAGRLYFVMDLVRGLPITNYCDEHRLTPRQRLELFVPVCQAVQHAHLKGIIHRDIKPSNVLIAQYDGKPVAKVIDFGVAKATGQSLTDKTLVTSFGNIVGTLEYMSPEQAEMNQLDIDTRSDIYSLGVLLYELLAGSTPFSKRDLEKVGMMEMLRVIREQEPSKPSTKLSSSDALPTLSANRGTEPAKLTRLVRGELDWIVMKALEKDRSRRYETANGFAMDVQRYLADEAVQACPPSAGYRLRKFLRRNKGPVLAVSLLVLALVAGIVGTTFGMVRAEKRRVEAEHARDAEAAAKLKAELAEAQTLEEFRASTDDAIEQLIGSKPELGPQEKAYLKKSLTRWQAFANRQGDDDRSQAVRAEGHYRVALLLQKLSERDAARKEYETVLDMQKSLMARHPDAPEYQLNLATAHNNLGVLLNGLGERHAARKEHEAARELRKSLTARYPDMPVYQLELAQTHNNLGVLLRGLGDRDAARKELEAARDLRKSLMARYSTVPGYQQDLAGTQFNLGDLLSDLGEHEAARKEYIAARDLQKSLSSQYPAVPNYQLDLAKTHHNLGVLLVGLGERAAARKEFEAASDLQKKLTDQYPAVLAHQVVLGATYCSLGTLLWTDGQPAESLKWFDQAIATLEPVHRADPRGVVARQNLRNSHLGRAIAVSSLQSYAEAVKNWDRAIELSPAAEQTQFRPYRANAKVNSGMISEAVAEVAELMKTSGWTADQWYSFACVYAVAGGKVADKKQEYADRAMEQLRLAVKAGFRNVAHMKKDTDLDILRERDDFKKLVEELEATNRKNS